MKKCKYITNSGNQCKRNVRKGNICWQHNTHKQHTKHKIRVIVKRGAAFILFLFSIFGDAPGAYHFIKSVSRIDWEEMTIECDRNTELGCNLNLSDSWKQSNLFNYWGDEDNLPYELFQISIISGDTEKTSSIINHKNETDVTDPSTDEVYFPIIRDSIFGYRQTGPFKIRIANDQLKFYGKLFDIRTDELMGWFNGDKFGVVESCSFSWNKDENGVEIIDKYGNVCFSMDLVIQDNHSAFKFLGYYKEDDTYIVYNCCLVNKTKSLNKAIELIKNIEPKFDHFGTNSLGKRNEKASGKCWANSLPLWQ